MKYMQRKWLALGLAGAIGLAAGPAFAQGAVSPEYQWLTFTVFAAIITLTMYVTYVAAKRVKSAVALRPSRSWHAMPTKAPVKPRVS